jgi:predicted nucleotidyltransferase
MAVKPVRRPETREVIYSSKRWTLLKELREKAIQLMETLHKSQIESIVHGSIARGDVTAKSDIDIFVPFAASSFTVENALEKAGLFANARLVMQATPSYALKAHIEIDDRTSVSFPLMNMRRVEMEFYKYGGEASLKDLRNNLRVAGADKRLMMIEPTQMGHVESAILGREEFVAKLLGVSLETVLDRVHALLKRDDVGRTGLFIKRELLPDETFEMALKRLAEQNPAVRRRLKAV